MTEGKEQRVHVAQRGIGLAASVPGDVVLEVAQQAARMGYNSFWLNNPPRASSLPLLGEVARNVDIPKVGVGVIPLSDQSPRQIAGDVREAHIDPDRLYLGIGSGSGIGGVQRVREGLDALRRQVECALVVAALGPKMCALAGERADGVLLNWLTPGWAERSIEWVRQAGQKADRPVPRIIAYVRVALGDDAKARLEREAASYEAIPHYAAHFRRMGTSAMGTTITGRDEAEIQEGLAGWDGVVDELVLRIVAAEDATSSILATVRAGHPEG